MLITLQRETSRFNDTHPNYDVGPYGGLALLRIDDTGILQLSDGLAIYNHLNRRVLHFKIASDQFRTWLCCGPLLDVIEPSAHQKGIYT